MEARLNNTKQSETSNHVHVEIGSVACSEKDVSLVREPSNIHHWLDDVGENVRKLDAQLQD